MRNGKKNTYTITYNNLEGANNNSNPRTYVYQSDIILKSLTREHYDFNGWYTDEGLINKVEN